MINSRRARVAALVAAGVIGFGGVAAAGPGGPFDLTGSDDMTTTTTSEVTTTTSEATTTTSEVPTTTSEVTTTTSEVVIEDDSSITQSVLEEVPDADDPMLVDDPATEFDETRCLDGNHGETVSAVARGEEGFEDVEQRVVAQSSCGKDVEVEVEVEADDDDEVEDEVEADDDGSDDQRERAGKPDKPERAGKQGNGPKKSSGG